VGAVVRLRLGTARSSERDPGAQVCEPLVGLLMFHRTRFQRLRRSLRFAHPYTQAACVAAAGSVLLVILAALFFLPRSNAGSLQAALTIITEILGVVLGAVLVVTVLLIEQSHDSEELLRSVFKGYRARVGSAVSIVNGDRRQLVAQLRAGKIELDQAAYISPESGPSSTKYRDLLNAQSGLIMLSLDHKGAPRVGQLEHDLKALGYSEQDVISVLHVRWASAAWDPGRFLTLVDKVFDLRFLQAWASGEFLDLAMNLYEERGADGVSNALSQLERARDYLRSKTFIAGVIVPTFTILLAIAVVIGTTPETVAERYHRMLLVAVLAGFTCSLILALRLVAMMLRTSSR
jgi:hypothetical protein